MPAAARTDPAAQRLSRVPLLRQLRRRAATSASFFCSADHLLPAALKTGKLEIRSNAVVGAGPRDENGLAKGVQYFDRVTGQEHQVLAKVVVMGASAVDTTRILLNSRSDKHANGIGNGSDVIGRYLPAGSGRCRQAPDAAASVAAAWWSGRACWKRTEIPAQTEYVLAFILGEFLWREAEFRSFQARARARWTKGADWSAAAPGRSGPHSAGLRDTLLGKLLGSLAFGPQAGHRDPMLPVVRAKPRRAAPHCLRPGRRRA